jgi:hypothetical protein
MLLPNRVVAIATAVIALALGVLPVIANFDWTSTAGVIAGIIGVLGVTQKWLQGWQQHEAQQMFVERKALEQPVPPVETSPRSVLSPPTPVKKPAARKRSAATSGRGK